MSALAQALADYLTMRRALGYKLDKTERRLGQFITFVKDRGEDHLTTETALAWATQPAGAAAIWTSRRLAEVRLFARHLHVIDPATEVPPVELLPGRTRRATPYLYAPGDRGPDAGHGDPARIAPAGDLPDADRPAGRHWHADRRSDRP